MPGNSSILGFVTLRCPSATGSPWRSSAASRPTSAPYLIQATSNPLAPAFYVMIAGVISFIAVFFVEERARRPLADEAPFAPVLA